MAASEPAGDRPRGWRPWLIGLPLVLAPVLLLLPALARGQVLFWGTPLLQFVPWRQLGLELIRQGQVPLWNPLVGAGAPLLANYQSALLYPPNWLGLLGELAVIQTWLVIAHWVLGAAGMTRLARGLGLARWPAVIAGMAFGLSSYVVARAGFFSINAAVAWAPWIVWGVDRLCRADLATHSRRRTSLVLTLCLSAQWLAGHAQLAWYTLLLAVVWAAWRLFSQPAGGRIRWRILPWLISPFLLAFLLAAPQLVPTLEYLGQSQRAASVDRELALTYSFWPWRLVELIAPGAFGQPAGGDYWGYGNYWEDAIHIGVLPLLLALAGVVGSWRKRVPRASLGRFISWVALTGFVLGLGQFTPIFPWLYDHVPTFALFQAPARWNLWFVFGLALLAGIGAQAWRPATGRQLYWLRLGTAGAAAVTGGAWLASRLLPAVRSSLLTAFGLAGGWLLLVGLLALVRSEAPPKWWRWAVLTVVSANLVIVGVGLNPTAPAALYTARTVFNGQAGVDGRVYLPAALEDHFKFDRFFRFDSFLAADDWLDVRRVGLPNTLMLEGVPSLNNFDPLLPARYRTWLEWLEGLPADRQEDVLASAGTGTLLQADEEGNGVVVRSLASRRAWFAAQSRWAEDGTSALELLASSELDLASQVVLEGAPPRSGPAQGGGVVKLVPTIGSQLRAEVIAETDGWLVVADTYFPGWQARLDGELVPILPANFLFRAVAVPAGQHEVEFTYRPTSFTAGLALFVAGLAGLAALAAWPRRDE